MKFSFGVNLSRSLGDSICLLCSKEEAKAGAWFQELDVLWGSLLDLRWDGGKVPRWGCMRIAHALPIMARQPLAICLRPRNPGSQSTSPELVICSCVL